MIAPSRGPQVPPDVADFVVRLRFFINGASMEALPFKADCVAVLIGLSTSEVLSTLFMLSSVRAVDAGIPEGFAVALVALARIVLAAIGTAAPAGPAGPWGLPMLMLIVMVAMLLGLRCRGL